MRIQQRIHMSYIMHTIWYKHICADVHIFLSLRMICRLQQNVFKVLRLHLLLLKWRKKKISLGKQLHTIEHASVLLDSHAELIALPKHPCWTTFQEGSQLWRTKTPFHTRRNQEIRRGTRLPPTVSCFSPGIYEKPGSRCCIAGKLEMKWSQKWRDG